MKSNSQKLKITAQLKEFGSVSRNWALSNFISRLGAIICDLTKEGWEFDTKYQTINGGKDYVYTVIKKPEEKKEEIVIQHDKITGASLFPSYHFKQKSEIIQDKDWTKI